MLGGYVDEARAFRDWLLRAIAGDPAELQIMYGIDGVRRLTEFDLPWLPGLRRLEAGARRQRRVRAVPARRLRRGAVAPLRGAQAAASPAREGWTAVDEVIEVPRERLAAARRRHLGGPRRAAALHALEGHGLGRGRPRRAVDPGVRRRRRGRPPDAAPPGGAGASGSTPRSASAASTRSVGAFTQSYGSTKLDASVLVIPHFGFLPGSDPRVKGTVAASRRACCATASCSATPPSTAPTACPARRARSSPAASGWRTTTPSRDD